MKKASALGCLLAGLHLLGTAGAKAAEGPSAFPAQPRAKGWLFVNPKARGTQKTTRLSLQGTRFTVNGKPTFLLGISYYGALGAPARSRRRDLAEVRGRGFNWVRVWATWAAFGNDVSAVDREGKPRARFLRRLQDLVAQCDRRGLVVDVTLSRGNGVTGPPRLQTLRAHRRAVAALTTALKPYCNWYLDLANERNVPDKRRVNFAYLKALRQLVKQLDPKRLVTASHAGDIPKEDLRHYLRTVGVDFICPHRPRQPGSPRQTRVQTARYLAAMKAIGRSVPVLYQEPFRRGFAAWQPKAADYRTDVRGARAGGAAGWCFHNGDQRGQAGGKPRRCFDLRRAGLFAQLDAEERKVLKALRSFRER
jgi:hypothetical protein